MFNVSYITFIQETNKILRFSLQTSHCLQTSDSEFTFRQQNKRHLISGENRENQHLILPFNRIPIHSALIDKSKHLQNPQNPDHKQERMKHTTPMQHIIKSFSISNETQTLKLSFSIRVQNLNHIRLNWAETFVSPIRIKN